MKTKLKLLLLSSVLLLASCTENERAKAFGGTTSVNLPAKQKLVNATWKESQLWYLTRPMRDGEKAETSTLHEQSSWGVLEGSVIFNESN